MRKVLLHNYKALSRRTCSSFMVRCCCSDDWNSCIHSVTRQRERALVCDDINEPPNWLNPHISECLKMCLNKHVKCLNWDRLQLKNFLPFTVSCAYRSTAMVSMLTKCNSSKKLSRMLPYGIWSCTGQYGPSVLTSDKLSYVVVAVQSLSHVQLSDAIWPSHPLSLPSPLALDLSQQQGIFQWVSSTH